MAAAEIESIHARLVELNKHPDVDIIELLDGWRDEFAASEMNDEKQQQQQLEPLSLLIDANAKWICPRGHTANQQNKRHGTRFVCKDCGATVESELEYDSGQSEREYARGVGCGSCGNSEQQQQLEPLSLLIDANAKWICPRGHTASQQCTKSLFHCKDCGATMLDVDSEYTRGVGCGSCGNSYTDAYQNPLWCFECAAKITERTKQRLKREQQTQARLWRDLQAAPHLSVDMLCALPNQMALESLLDDIVKLEVNQAILFTLLVFDIDNFKEKNTQYGHNGCNDKVLKPLGKCLRTLRDRPDSQWPKDKFTWLNVHSGNQEQKTTQIERVWCFRQGGDEFALVVKDHEKSRPPIFIYDHLLNEIKSNHVPVQISVGVAQNHRGCGETQFKNSENWLECADQALDAAKKSGKNTVRYWSNESKTAQTKQKILDNLKRSPYWFRDD
eukprot:CAMPEP_0202731852 /NCGR_PEP_ID=MMETSP1385-20130828/187359_1 /ASSEMBLY_ACC=CAM_ASM_000861 /TAXON_ID=933848 /ORGANISM="Elphidium margaritaceum" /LENGTH=444 /DNA_ID=CAMNT_0049398155 /DNA_START=21 /DNA_END=1355 /DNA_ORIENTATION=-